MDMLTQLNQAMTYIETHIEDELTLSDVSSITAYSPYHFGRLFYYIADMPLSEYIRKRKLSLAAIRLQSGNGNEKIIDLAVMYGYDSADSFTRAFVKQHGVTPSAARHPGVNLTIFPPLIFQIKIKGVRAMNWRIEQREAFEVFGMEGIFRSDESDNVAGFWAECHRNGSYERLFDSAGGLRAADGRGMAREDGSCVIFAACSYFDPGDDRFPYIICAKKAPDSKTEGFTVAQIKRTTWAVFRSEKSEHIGKEIPVLFNRAYSEWLPSSGYERADGSDMEVYYTTEDGMHFEEVWIPVHAPAQ